MLFVHRAHLTAITTPSLLSLGSFLTFINARRGAPG
jgi:hypothetical protein